MPKIQGNPYNIGDEYKKQIVDRLYEEQDLILMPDPKRIQSVPIRQITPRKVNNYPKEAIDKLADSIERVGMTQAPNVFITKNKELREKGIYYEISDGERRYRAWLQLLNKAIADNNEEKIRFYSKMPAIVRDDYENEAEIHRASNFLQREFDPFTILANSILGDRDDAIIEIAKKKFGEDKVNDMIKNNEEVNVNDSVIAEYVSNEFKEKYGKDYAKSTLRKYVRLFRNSTPQLKQAIFDNVISLRDAKEYLVNVSKEEQNMFVDLSYNDRQAYTNKLDSLKNKSTELIEIEADFNDPIKELKKLINKLYKDISELEQIEKSIKSISISANTKDVLKSLKQIRKKIVETNEKPIK